MSVNVPTNKTVTTTDAQLLPSSSSFNDVWAGGFDTNNPFANAYGALLRGVVRASCAASAWHGFCLVVSCVEGKQDMLRYLNRSILQSQADLRLRFI